MTYIGISVMVARKSGQIIDNNVAILGVGSVYLSIVGANNFGEYTSMLT